MTNRTVQRGKLWRYIDIDIHIDINTIMLTNHFGAHGVDVVHHHGLPSTPYTPVAASLQSDHTADQLRVPSMDSRGTKKE